jgi:predicted MFS family arabinose efflux permease
LVGTFLLCARLQVTLLSCYATCYAALQAFGWRSTFMALAAYGALAAVLILAFVPETHQFFVLRQLEQHKPAAAQAMKERETIQAELPVFQAPWVPLK